MATHAIHEDISTHGLADDCERCDELAKNPLDLDEQNFAACWRHMTEVEWGGASYRSHNDALLGKTLYTWAVFIERHTTLDPRRDVPAGAW